jgi:hypothetical protein
MRRRPDPVQKPAQRPMQEQHFATTKRSKSSKNPKRYTLNSCSRIISMGYSPRSIYKQGKNKCAQPVLVHASSLGVKKREKTTVFHRCIGL